MKLIVGLGNPGKKYARTRHNIGFMTVDALHEALKEYGSNNWELSKKFNAAVSGCTVHNEKIVLAKPMTFMNDSGQAVQLLMRYYKIPARDLIVTHDDKDLPLGTIKAQTDRRPQRRALDHRTPRLAKFYPRPRWDREREGKRDIRRGGLCAL